MPTPFELQRVADLIKLAADTANECSQMKANGEATKIADICLRIKADAEELDALSREMRRKASERDG